MYSGIFGSKTLSSMVFPGTWLAALPRVPGLSRSAWCPILGPPLSRFPWCDLPPDAPGCAQICAPVGVGATLRSETRGQKLRARPCFPHHFGLALAGSSTRHPLPGKATSVRVLRRLLPPAQWFLPSGDPAPSFGCWFFGLEASQGLCLPRLSYPAARPPEMPRGHFGVISQQP